MNIQNAALAPAISSAHAKPNKLITVTQSRGDHSAPWNSAILVVGDNVVVMVYIIVEVRRKSCKRYPDVPA